MNSLLKYKYKNGSREIPRGAVTEIKNLEIQKADARMTRKYFAGSSRLTPAPRTGFHLSGRLFLAIRGTRLVLAGFLLQIHRRAGLNMTSPKKNLLEVPRKRIPALKFYSIT